MQKVILYTDGACSGNPGPGGWGCILSCQGKTKEFSGAQQNTTNNQMEITAVLQGLKKLKYACEVEIYSDSAYVVNAFKENWVENWISNGWKNANKKPVANKELWIELLNELNKHKISWFKVKGHSDNEMNNRCDLLATSQIKKISENK